MYNWVTRRKIARTDGSTYPVRAAQTVDAIVAKWIPTFAALLACAVTPARPKLDVRSYDWQPSFGWIQTAVDAQVRTYSPATSSELQSYRTPARPSLDVRRYEWAPSFVDVVTRVDANVRAWMPAIVGELASRRTDGGRLLDVRSYEWGVDETSWIQATQTTPPTVAQTWPAFQSTSGRTGDRARLDVRLYDWSVDETSWIASTQTVTPPTVAQTSPAWTSAAQSFRTAKAPTFDLFRTPSSPNTFGVPDDWITWVPQQDDGGRTRDRARLDVRAYEWGQPAWITASLPVAITQAQTWPAILDKGQSYRPAARPSLDVRAYDWAPAFGWIGAVVEAQVARFAPVFAAEHAAFRTAERPRLDVRRYEWIPAFGWVRTPVDAELARFAPVFAAELASFRTRERARLDVRGYLWVGMPLEPPVFLPLWFVAQANRYINPTGDGLA